MAVYTSLRVTVSARLFNAAAFGELRNSLFPKSKYSLATIFFSSTTRASVTQFYIRIT